MTHTKINARTESTMASAATHPRPLDGVTVISLEHAIAAPFCTRQLADMGARVIKIERPGVGDFARGYDDRVRGLASHFVWTNRSKESLTLDLKKDEAKTILFRLLDQADVLVQNLAPGASARMGLSFDALHESHPRLIVCDISGYGEGGPYQDKKAYDLLIQSEGGFLSVTGSPDGPAKAGCSISDIAAGMYAYSSILSALLLRERTGQGSRLDVSMLESMVEWMGFPMYYAFDGAPPPPRAGASHATICPYGPFPVGDGSEIMLGLQNEREWAAFCKIVLKQPELAKDARFTSNLARVENKEALCALIVKAFATLTREQALQRLEDAQIANASVNTMRDVWAHPQLAARKRWREVSSQSGPLPALIPPASSSAFEARMDAVPSLGEHRASILAELGYSADDVQALLRQKVI
jgi:itaconate CoA-transferase